MNNNRFVYAKEVYVSQNESEVYVRGSHIQEEIAGYRVQVSIGW
jgi:hypothetical protein